jgi:hypothetical protein
VPTLILKSAETSRSSGTWSDDDYAVLTRHDAAHHEALLSPYLKAELKPARWARLFVARTTTISASEKTRSDRAWSQASPGRAAT